MRFLVKWAITFLFALTVFVFNTHSAFASAEFSTSFDSLYTVKNDSLTRVEHKIEIKNKLAHIYTKEYTIAIGSSSITKLQVFTNGEVAPFKRTDDAGITTLTISVPNPAIGKDQILRINISYETRDLVEHFGKVWEVNIPKLLRANEAESYHRQVVVPSNFGPPTVEYPKSTTTSNDEHGNTVFDYRGYPSESITLLFGNHVDYQLDLTYKIENPTVATAETELALPPDTEYQRIILAKIDPPPLRIKLDEDGNWLAIYSLRSQEKLAVKASLYASVYPYPYYEPLSRTLDPHLVENKYWEVKADSVKSLATTLKTPANIYSYLVDHLSYDYSRVSVGAERLGAAKALQEPNSSICTEYTDTFIALARAAGIPAREINGYAHTADSLKKPGSSTADTLHAWPEYYDSESRSWVQVDPTWGHTTGGVDYFHKLDFGHITFVRHGLESEYPYPAGSYKESVEEKSVNVSIASTLPTTTVQTPLRETEGGYLLTNAGNAALVNYNLKLPNGQTYTVKYLPPFGVEKISSSEVELSLWQRLLNFFRALL